MISKTENICGIKLPEPDFGKTLFSRHQGGECTGTSIADVSFPEFNNYCSLLEGHGFTAFKSRVSGKSVYRTYKFENTAVFLSFYPSYGRMSIVCEADFNEYIDNRIKRTIQPLFTQVDMNDFGLSDCIRLPDGRFIVVDGGYDYEPDSDALIECLREQSPDKKPIIAMWIITHAHDDHYRAVTTFFEKYPDAVEIQGFLYNFPDVTDDYDEDVPWLNDDREDLTRFNNTVKRTGAPVYRAHTGQVYNISGAQLEILISPDDTFDNNSNPNVLSLVLRLNMCGQTILLCADCFFDYCDLLKMHGNYLKSDIMQAPHHALGGGTPEGYRLIDPQTVIFPIREHLFFKTEMYSIQNSFLLQDLNVADMYTGGTGNVTLQLPYNPRPNGRWILLDRLEQKKRESGATSWVFTNLSKKDCVFETLCNARNARIYADLYTDNPDGRVEHIEFCPKAFCITKTDLFNSEEADGDALFFNPNSLAKKEIPDNALITVHLRSNVPVVITCKKPEAYRY